MINETPQLAALSRLFSSAVFRELARHGRSAIFARLFRSTGLAEIVPPSSTVGDCFEAAFRELKRAGQRDEYVYRAAVTRKVLLGRHSLNTACMLSEFRTGSSKADLVILNGTATAYEIKSERDSLARLSTQVENYKKVFAAVNVISSQNHVKGVIDNIPDDIGVMYLTERYRIRCEREAIVRSDALCPVTMFESVRTKEAKDILVHLGITIPSVPNTKLHSEMRKIFAEQSPADVHHAMVTTLKRSRDLSVLGELVDSLPSSLHAAALSTRLKKTEHERLIRAVSSPLVDALHWG